MTRRLPHQRRGLEEGVCEFPFRQGWKAASRHKLNLSTCNKQLNALKIMFPIPYVSNIWQPRQARSSVSGVVGHLMCSDGTIFGPRPMLSFLNTTGPAKRNAH